MTDQKGSRVKTTQKDSACETHLIDDVPASVDAFGSHDKLSEAIADLIVNERGGRAIALVGSWGSGKSTVIRLLETRLKSKAPKLDARCFCFDAWAHSGDPLRRTFIESLIAFFARSGWTVESEWQAELDRLARRREDVNTVTRPELTMTGGMVLFAALLVPLGYKLVELFLERLAAWQLLGGLFLILLPVLVGLVSWCFQRHVWRYLRLRCPTLWQWISIRCPHCVQIKEQGEPLLAMLLNRSGETVRTASIRTPDPSTVEFQAIFEKLLLSTLAKEERKLTIIIDNLDRVEVADAMAIWSTMQTFLALPCEGGPGSIGKRLWLVVPFDERTPRRLWEHESHGDKTSLAQAFIEKTFQIVFRVPQPVLTDWRKLLLGLLKEAFPQHNESEFPIIFRLYDSQIKNIPTPRDLKLFVNKLGAYHRIWKDSIELAIQAAFVLNIDQKSDVAENIISGKFLDQRTIDILGDSDWQKWVAALHFGVQPDKALHVLIEDRMARALGEGNQKDIDEVARSVSGFETVLERTVEAQARQWGANETAAVAKAAVAMRSFKEVTDGEFARIWVRLRAVAVGVSKWESLNSDTVVGLIILVQTCPLGERNVVAKQLIRAVCAADLDTQKDAPETWSKAAVHLLLGLRSEGVPDEILKEFRVPGKPEVILRVYRGLREIDSTMKVLRYFVPKDDIKAITSVLVEKAKGLKFDTNDSDLVQSMRHVPAHWDWDEFVFGLTNVFVQQQNMGAKQYRPILETLLDLTYAAEASPKMKEAIHKVCSDGHIMHYLYRAFQENDQDAASLCLLPLALEVPNGNTSNIWNSENGRQHFNQVVGTPDGNGKVVEAFAVGLLRYGLVDAFLDTTKKASQMRPFAISVLRAIMKRDDSITSITVPMFVKHTDLMWPALRKEAQAFLGNHPQPAELLSAIASTAYRQEQIQMYADAYEACKEDARIEYQQFLVKGLKSTLRDGWQPDISNGGLRVKLTIALLKDKASLDLGADFHDALLNHANAQRDKKTIPSDLEADWPMLLGAMTNDWRQTFLRNLWDIIVGEDKRPVHVFAAIYGDSLSQHAGASIDASEKVVRTLIPRVIERKNAEELAWVARLLGKAPTVLANSNVSSLNALKDRLSKALEATSDKVIKDRMMEIAKELGLPNSMQAEKRVN